MPDDFLVARMSAAICGGRTVRMGPEILGLGSRFAHPGYLALIPSGRDPARLRSVISCCPMGTSLANQRIFLNASPSLCSSQQPMIQQPKRDERFTVVRSEGPLDNALRGAVVAIGNFDGVHRGHCAVIAAARTRAQVLGRPAAALTFEPHPRRFFSSDEPLFRLTDEQARLRLLSGAGLDGAIVLRFDARLAQLSAQDFISEISGRALRRHWGRDRLRLPFRSQSCRHARLPCLPWARIRFCRGHRAAL